MKWDIKWYGIGSSSKVYIYIFVINKENSWMILKRIINYAEEWIFSVEERQVGMHIYEYHE